MNFEEINGLILLDKSVGMTSFGADTKFKRLLQTKKVGHCGTLDPFATGVLPVCFGKGLRFVRYADKYDKAYFCKAVFGKTTDTLDIEGEVVSENIPSGEVLDSLVSSDYKLIRDAFEEISHITMQTPPKYSAKKINGQKAYELARKGIEVELKPNKVTIHKLDVIDISVVDGLIEVSFEVYCSKGTYIRTICDDVGKITGFGAFAKELRRIEVGPFDLSKTYTMEQIEEMASREDYSFILDASKIVDYMPVLKLNATAASMVKCGKKLNAKYFTEELESNEPGTLFRAMHEDKVIAVMYESLEDDKHVLRIERMLA